MAEPWTFLGSRQTVESLGGTATRDVVEIQAQTDFSGVFWAWRVPRADFFHESIDGSGLVWKSEGDDFAAHIENIAQNSHVAGMDYFQDVNAANKLLDFFNIYVTSASGNSSVAYPVLLGLIASPTLPATIEQIASQLTANEGAQ